MTKQAKPQKKQTQKQKPKKHGVCPIIYNETEHTVVVFQERGVLYNKQVLHPGEAVGISRLETAGVVVPYRVHAVIGDERSLPTRQQSVKTLITTTAIPTAFIVGAFASAMSAGALTGPSAALAPMVSGMVVKGVVIDSAALAAGAVAASRAAMVAELLVKKHPEKFMAKSKHFRPGQRYLVVRGGVQQTLSVEEVKEKEFHNFVIRGPGIKEPMDTLKDKVQYYLPGNGNKNQDGIGKGVIIPPEQQQQQQQQQQQNQKKPKSNSND